MGALRPHKRYNMPRIVPLRAKHQQYAWGRPGEESLVYQLQKNSGFFENTPLDSTERYSELWMGTHPNGPSLLADDPSVTLEQHLKSQNHPHSSLPFLFKVLSIDKPLSIQAHPDRTLAQKLHAQFPEIYRDANHKPELACALTPFEALCGFRPATEILDLLNRFGGELVALLGNQEIQNLGDSLENNKLSSDDVVKDLFSRLMDLSDEQVCEPVTRMVQGLEDQKEEPFVQLLNYLHLHFPGDIGVFCAFFLNHIKMQPGEAIFLGANLPHCYLSGNCVECMSCSDNVVRAGLTPKLRDAQTLCAMLDYSQKEIPVLRGEEVQNGCWRYPTPVDEFLLYRVFLSSDQGEYVVPRPENSPMIVLAIEGRASLSYGEETDSSLVQSGSIFYVPEDIELKLTP